MERRREDLAGQAAEHREEFREHEADGLAEVTAVSERLFPELVEVDPVLVDLQRQEEAVPLRRDEQHAIADRRQRDRAERPLGAPPENAQSSLEERDQLG